MTIVPLCLNFVEFLQGNPK